jgi:cytochrome c oxidase cbb3-type subunit III
MKHKLFTFSAILLMAGTLSAQTADVTSANTGIGLTSILIAVNAILLLFVVFLLGSLTTAVQKLRVAEDGKVQISWWEKFAALKTEKSEGELILEEDFDGIKELDNPTPPWYNFIFYITIAAAVLYLLNYHVFKIGSLQAAEYTNALAESKAEVDAYLKKSGNAIDENSVVLLTSKKDIDEGAVIFQEKCAVCHLADGGGLVGPNLTDNYWIHGGDVKSIFKTLKYGVPAKGMIAWQNALSGKQMQSLASFIHTLKGTTPAQAKEPQGDLFVDAGVSINDSTIVGKGSEIQTAP